MDNLRFGTTARRKARRRQRIRRLALLGWALSTLGVLVGTPATRSTAIDVLEQIALGSERDGARTEFALTPHTPPGEDHRPSPRARELIEATREAARGGNSIVEIIHSAAERYGIDGDYLVSIAECESGLDPRAYNSAGYHGLFQYDAGTWEAYGKGSIWDPAAQARATAMLIADGQASRWPNCA